MPWLRKGRHLVSNLTGRCYRIVSDKVAQGGFGEVYRGAELDDHRDPCANVAIKVSLNPLSWHGEAYFGWLLSGERHVVRLRDAFPLVDGVGPARQVKYVLVFDWMQGGTVADALSRSGAWQERRVTQQIAALLRTLTPLHRRGICHADITTRNVYVDGKALLLGDFGIAKQSLRSGPISMDVQAPDIFIPPDVYPFCWTPSDDVYQVGLIALSLLAGEIITSPEVCGRALKLLQATDRMKGWIRDALKDRRERFRDSDEALTHLLGEAIRPARSPRSLLGQCVVFTGILTMTRDAARSRARRAGATVQPRVNGQTSLIVAGQPNPLMIGQRRGTKLFDAQRRIRRGQRMAIIDEKQFRNLLAKVRGQLPTR